MDLKEFFKNNPTITKAGVCREAGISVSLLNFIIYEKRSLTPNVKNKLYPVLKKYGYQERDARQA